MPRHKLKNAPLQEVIFEFFWKLPLDKDGIPYDPGFTMAQGVFASKIKKDFPVQKRLVPESLPIRIYPAIIHQFWKEELTWPVVQLGPGLLAVNDTEKNYSWKGNYETNIKKAIQTLKNSYDQPLEIQRVRLKYVDAVEFDPKSQTAADFIARNMKTELINHYAPAGPLKDLNIVQTFELKMDTLLHLNIQSGIFNRTGSPSIIWTTAVEKSSGLDFKHLFSWLEYGHSVVSENFMSMLNPAFYDSFDPR